ncbi:hypothetical protein BDV95DRAFT_592452 [Massariosphaeria phaeospora]|uniref:Uncharacterized protein n=1 Tax=Massariosphaeria phaeospora TaxID=100035 RepID=A0A7C8MIS5_9PLEO|nr:hypothetical protein BDV95DRAFT_592452 [Massariosphaeria phaeospora]
MGSKKKNTKVTVPGTKAKTLKDRRRDLKKAKEKAEDVKFKNATASQHNKHTDRMEAEAVYEDFLYYQNPTMRFQMSEDVSKPNIRGVAVLGGVTKKIIRSATEYCSQFKEKGIGTCQSIDGKLRPSHDQLHWLTPVWRRGPSGHGRPEPRSRWPPYQLHLDEEGFESRRREIEDMRGEVELNTNEGRVYHASHSERRMKECKMFEQLSSERSTIADAFRNTRTKKRVHISAAERSDDWPISYDCLGIVKSGYFAMIPPKNHKASNENSEKTNPKEKDGESIKLPSRNTRGNAAPQVVEDPGRYLIPESQFFEFDARKPEEPRPKSYERQISTPWAEATNGRREFHVYNQRAPPSPVDSPPHSPISDVDVYRDVAQYVDVNIDDDISSSNSLFDKFLDENMPTTLTIPVDVSPSDNDHEMYRKKFTDHYGVKEPEWPQFSSRGIGRGIRVPYGPVDVLSLSENEQAKYPMPEGLIVDGRYTKPAPDGTSMQLMREAFKIQKPKPFSTKVTEKNGNDVYNGDLFTKSYHEASGTTGRHQEAVPVDNAGPNDGVGPNDEAVPDNGVVPDNEEPPENRPESNTGAGPRDEPKPEVGVGHGGDTGPGDEVESGPDLKRKRPDGESANVDDDPAPKKSKS